MTGIQSEGPPGAALSAAVVSVFMSKSVCEDLSMCLAMGGCIFRVAGLLVILACNCTCTGFRFCEVVHMMVINERKS